jgi:membrane-associated protein
MIAVNWLSPKDLIDTFGVAGLLLVVFLESGVLPVPFPGDSLLFIAGFFASTGAHSSDPHLNLAAVVIGSFGAAVLGAQVGYWIGKFFGTALFKPDARIFKTKYLDQAHVFFEERGNRAVVIARFIPFVRTIVPIIAGAGKMTQRAFFTANVIGAALWAVGISLLGFFLGKQIGQDNIDHYLLPIVALIIVLSLIPPFLEWRRHKRANAGVTEVTPASADEN